MHLVRRFLSANKGGVALLSANGLGQAAANVVLAFIVRDVFDEAASSGPPPDLFSWMFALVAILIVRAVLVYDEVSRGERLGQSFAHQLRVSVFEHLGNTSQPRLRARSKGALTLRLSNDVTPLRQWVTLGFARLIVAGTAVVGTLAAVTIIDWRLSALAAVSIASGVLLTRLASNGFGQAVSVARRRRGRMANDLAERLSASATVAVFGQSRRETRRIARHSEGVMRSMVTRARYAGLLRSIAETAIGLATGGALLFGAWLVEFGGMSVGSLAAALGVMGLLSVPARQLERVFEYYLAAKIGHAKIEEILALPLVSSDATAAQPTNATISLRRARVAPDAERLTVRIGYGKKVALGGPFAASTLTAIAGLSEPERGRVRIGRVSVTAIHPRRRRRLVTLLSADVPLLRGTIRRNIAYANPRASEDEITQAIERAGLTDEIDGLPDGLNTRVNEGGLNLAPALRLQVGLARALLGEPPIVLVDQMGLGGQAQFKKTLIALMASYPGTIVVATDDADIVRMASMKISAERVPTALPSAEIIPFRTP